jgi:hypothetical protein
MNYDATYGAIGGRTEGRMDEPEPPDWYAEPREATSFQVRSDRAPPVGARMMMVVFHHPATDVIDVDFIPSEMGCWIVTDTEDMTTPGGVGTVTVYLSASKLAG